MPSISHIVVSTIASDGISAVQSTTWNSSHTFTTSSGSILGRLSAGTGAVEELTLTQVSNSLTVFSSVAKGVVPASGGGTTNFLRADATFAAPNGVWPNTINVADFGATGNGGTDDTAALNLAFASLAGGAGLVLFPAGTYLITDTILVGSLGASSFISIMCPSGPNNTLISYQGPDDGRPAVRFAKNKYFICTGLNIRNDSGVKTANVGMILGGPGGGNQCLQATFSECFVNNFFVGITDGFGGAASEITWIELTLANCTTGMVWNDFNSLNQTLINLAMGANTIGLDTGAIEGFHVLGGSASNNTTDFQIESGGISTIRNFRSESPGTFAVGVGSGTLLIDFCSINDGTGANTKNYITGTFGRLDIRDSILTGFVKLSGSLRLTMIGNTVLSDPNTLLPFLIDLTASWGSIARAHCVNNRDTRVFPPNQCYDFTGIVQYSGVSGSPFILNQLNPLISKYTDYEGPAANTVTPFGSDYLMLAGVRQLAEGPSPGNHTTSNFTDVTNSSSPVGSAVLHFAATPKNVVPFQIVSDVTTAAAIPAFARVDSVTATTVILSTNVAAPGVGSGDTIQFTSVMGNVTPGNNLRVTTTFASTNNAPFTFRRNVLGGTGGDNLITASSGRFYPADVGKAIKVAGAGSGAWTDMYGSIIQYVSSVSVYYQPGGNQAPTGFSSATITIGADEPDANYMVAGICGDQDENFWVDTISSAGFTIHSSNAASAAVVTCLIVR